MKRTAFCALTFILFSLAAQAQTPQPKPELQDVQLVTELIKAQLEAKLYALTPEANSSKSGAASKIAELHLSIATRPAATRLLLGMNVGDYIRMRNLANSAPQVSQAVAESDVNFQLLQAAQNSVIIEQNQKIIGLLEQLVKKK